MSLFTENSKSAVHLMFLLAKFDNPIWGQDIWLKLDQLGAPSYILNINQVNQAASIQNLFSQ